MGESKIISASLAHHKSRHLSDLMDDAVVEARASVGGARPARSAGERPSVESLYAQMKHTRVLWSFGCARGGVHLAIELQKRLLRELGEADASWKALGEDASYIDCVAQREGSKPNMRVDPTTHARYAWDGSLAKDAPWRTDDTWDSTWRNDHWAEYYYMGALLAHTVVVVLDTAWVKSPYCQGELALFLRNVRHAYEAGAREEFPGSRFQLVVIYDDTPGTVCDGEGCRHDSVPIDLTNPKTLEYQMLAVEKAKASGGAQDIPLAPQFYGVGQSGARDQYSLCFRI